MLCGRVAPELGGSDSHLDILGVNFYSDNQWFHNDGGIPFGSADYRPFSDMLAELHRRYRPPVLITETGAEGEASGSWLRYVAGEVRLAIQQQVPVTGLCIYPIADYPGWEDGRHCRCGLIKLDDDWAIEEADPWTRK